MDDDKPHKEKPSQKRMRGKPCWGGVCDFQMDGQVGFMEKVTLNRKLKETGNQGNQIFPSKWAAP